MNLNYFSNLNYSLGDEDSTLEYQLLNERCNHVFSIAGSGGRIIPLLAKKPENLTCVDISVAQLFLTELRIEALKQLRYEEFLGFLGYPPYCCSSTERKRIFSELNMAIEKKSNLYTYFENSAWKPIIYLGKFEKLLIFFSKLVKYLTNKKIIKIFDFQDRLLQKDFYSSRDFPKYRWQMAIKLLGNAQVLNCLLYKGAYPKKNIPGSYSQIYHALFERIYTQIPARKSFFLQLLLLGCIQYPEGNLIEAHKTIFQQAKEHASHVNIKYVNLDVLQAIRKAPISIDFLSLSDVPSFFPETLQQWFMQEIKGKLGKDAMVIYRNHMRIVHPILEGYKDITYHFLDLIQNEVTQLWVPKVFVKRGNP